MCNAAWKPETEACSLWMKTLYFFQNYFSFQALRRSDESNELRLPKIHISSSLPVNPLSYTATMPARYEAAGCKSRTTHLLMDRWNAKERNQLKKALSNSKVTICQCCADYSRCLYYSTNESRHHQPKHCYLWKWNASINVYQWKSLTRAVITVTVSLMRIAFPVLFTETWISHKQHCCKVRSSSAFSNIFSFKTFYLLSVEEQSM